MSDILFPQYRAYEAGRIAVNDAMSALLVGSRLAGHTLSLTAGSSVTLGQLFPEVEHIDRFNIRSDRAREYLNNGAHHLASVAVPYALATHEDFVTEMLDLLVAHGRTLVDHGRQIRAWNMHAVLYETCGEVGPEDWLQSFHVLRELRNCITHSGGLVDDKLRNAIANMGPAARAGWERLNRGAKPEDIEDSHGCVVLTAEHFFTAFAVTKRIGREINGLLGRELDGLAWALIAATDFERSTSKVRNSTGWRRSLRGYARQFYGASPITDRDLEAAARQLGLWTSKAWA